MVIVKSWDLGIALCNQVGLASDDIAVSVIFVCEYPHGFNDMCIRGHINQFKYTSILQNALLHFHGWPPQVRSGHCFPVASRDMGIREHGEEHGCAQFRCASPQDCKASRSSGYDRYGDSRCRNGQSRGDCWCDWCHGYHGIRMQRWISVARSRAEQFGCDNNSASRCGIGIMGSCWQCNIVEGNINDSCGCAGDGVVSIAFLKDDVTAFNSRT